MIHFLFHWFMKLTGCLPQMIFFRMKVHYEDRAIQGRHIKGKAIVVCNHNSLYDFAALLFLFWTRTLRPAAAELLYHKNFMMTFFLNLLGCIKVERDQYDFSFLDRLKKILKKLEEKN